MLTFKFIFSVLLSKLHHYGIRGVLNDWFSSYLSGRVQTTEVKMTVSSKVTTPCGIAQGSVLGPLLFLIYINDIPNSSSKLSYCLFADDSNMLFADNNLRSLEATVNNELKNECDWLTANKLTLNTKKSYFVIFRPRQKKLEYDTNTLTSLECKEYVKYLGILIDSHLSWKFHIDYVAFKLSKIVGIIARLRHFVPFNTLLSIYQSLMFPYLTFGLSAWGQAAQLLLKKLLLLQKRAIRFMNFSKPRTHAVPLFISSKILPINMLYLETLSTLMYDISNNSAPQNISRLFRKSNLIHPYKTRSSSSGNFYIQYSRLNQQHNSTTCFGARVWNCLPPQVRQLPKKQFKKKVREILFAIFHAEDTYIEAPTLLLKIAKYVK